MPGCPCMKLVEICAVAGIRRTQNMRGGSASKANKVDDRCKVDTQHGFGF